MAKQPQPGADQNPVDVDPTCNHGFVEQDQTTSARPDTFANIRSPNSTHGPQLNIAVENPPLHNATPSSTDLAGPVASDAGNNNNAKPLGYYGISSGYLDGMLTTEVYPPASNAPLHAPVGWRDISTAPVRRRAVQACNPCRQRKARCDEFKPQCRYCRDNGHTCTYNDAKPSKADRAQQELMEGQDIIKNELHKLQTEVAGLKYFLQGSQHQTVQGTAVGKSGPSGAPLQPPPSGVRESSRPGKRKMEPSGDTLLLASLDVGHSVGVHRLLRWNSVRHVLSFPEVLRALQIQDIRSLNEYLVMQTEERKGVLRVFGRGQGPDQGEDRAGTWTNPSTPAKTEDSTSGLSPSAFPPEVWGHGLGLPNMVNGRSSNNSMDDHPGGLNGNGNLRMDPATMNDLLASYLDTLHILHPFLSRAHLKQMFDRVQLHTNSHLRPAVRTYAGANDRAPKRKLSTSALPIERDSTHPSDEPLYEYRISTAIVLLVMALGKICQAKQPLPGPVCDRPQKKSKTRSPYRGGSPYSRASSSRKKSPASSRSSQRHVNQMHAQHDTLPADLMRGEHRNLDIIPGLAYYAKAAEMLGALQGGNELCHVQARLLASLYCGQLASSIEAWSWLTQASRACLFLMKRHSSEFEKPRDPESVELLHFAYWTCYQLEGDILAELDLQPSGIELYHKKTNTRFPKITQAANNSPEIVLLYYISQIHLRKSLNSFQSFLYPPDATLEARTVESLLSDRSNCLLAMREWRIVQSKCQWDDRAYLTDNILEARLRAKYYGALYIINRPLVDYVLHKMPDELTPEIKDYMRNYRDALPLPSDTIEHNVDNMEVYRACVECIDAAKRSTTAFDGIILNPVSGELRQRLIVTNIVGTAHAQFGNMLVLSATYMSHLGFIIKHSELVTLLERTIRFLHSHRPISYTLSQDADILEGILVNIAKFTDDPFD